MLFGSTNFRSSPKIRSSVFLSHEAPITLHFRDLEEEEGTLVNKSWTFFALLSPLSNDVSTKE